MSAECWQARACSAPLEVGNYYPIACLERINYNSPQATSNLERSSSQARRRTSRESEHCRQSWQSCFLPSSRFRLDFDRFAEDLQSLDSEPNKYLIETAGDCIAKELKSLGSQAARRFLHVSQSLNASLPNDLNKKALLYRTEWVEKPGKRWMRTWTGMWTALDARDACVLKSSTASSAPTDLKRVKQRKHSPSSPYLSQQQRGLRAGGRSEEWSGRCLA